MKPSILIIADFPNWAYYEIQQFVKNNLANQYDIYCDFLVFNSKTKSKNPINRIKLLISKYKYQHLKKDNSYDIVVYLGFYFPEYMKVNWSAKKVVKGIYTEGFPPQNANFKGTIDDFKKIHLKNVDALVCGSKKSRETYANFFDKVYFASAIKNKNIFKKSKVKKINKSSKFIVGWTGNPNRGFKGFYSHVIPAVELAQKKYPEIKLKTRFSGPMKTLPFFYEDVDVIVIASDADVGPSLFSEASLMEVPSISTKIGLPQEILNDGVNGFFVEKNIQEISNKIIELYENRELLYNMSKNIRNDYLVIKNEAELANNWNLMFNDLLKD